MKKVEFETSWFSGGGRKLLRTMKLTLLLLIVCFVQVSASVYSQATKFSFEIKNKKVEDVLRQIEAESEFRFFYQREQVDVERKVNLNVENQSVEAILAQLFAGQEVVVDVRQDNLILIKTNVMPYQTAGNTYPAQQQRTVSGKVTDTTGQPLPGVTVLVKGTTNGTITDNNGNYSLGNISSSAMLVFSFVGMRSQEIAVGNQTNINVTMQEETIGIDEVVAIGYGTMKKSDLTGSISSVKAEDIKDRPITTVAQALQGKASGVLVRTNSAAPGSKLTVNIRGQNSLKSDSGPLYIVNGLPLDDISFIPPEEIQSIEILKDGSSTAIYGSRGANGVILVTTKKGKNGKTQISYNFRTSIEKLSHGLNLMNAEEFAKIYSEWQQMLNPNISQSSLWFNGSTLDRPLPNEAGKGTDWFKEVTRTGMMNNHRININGGSTNNTYSISLHYLEHKGVVLGSSFNRLGVNVSNQFDVFEWLNAGIDAFVTNSDRNSSDENTIITNSGASTQSVIHAAAKMSPATPVYTKEGLYYQNSLPASVTLENPVASANEVEDITKTFTAFGKLYFEFNPIKNLNIRLSGGANRSIGKTYFYNPSTTIYGKIKGGEAKLGENSVMYLINENTISYNAVLNQVHKLDVLAGFTYEKEVEESFSNSATGFFTDFYKYNKLQAANTYGAPNSNKAQWQLASFINRLNYVYNQKYLFTFTSRYDGSSKFGGSNKWGYFPSVALAWRVSEEPYMKPFKDLSNLKIRTSLGTTGNSNIGLYQSLPSFNLANYSLGRSVHPGVAAGRLENRNLKWETTRIVNLGIDATLMKKINIVFDLYKKETDDLLYSVPLIETSGYSSTLRNVGSLENRGIEISVNTPIIDRNLKWEIGGMISLNRNKITQLTGDASLDWRIGNPLGAKRGYRVDGIINDQEELNGYVNKEGKPINNAKLGDWKIIDVNDDGKINSDDMKNEIIFDPNPDVSFSISNEFLYKNFALSIFFQGMYGNQLINRNNAWFFTALDQIRSNLSKDVLNNYWRPDRNYDVKYARLGSSTYSQIYEQNGFAEDGSFLKLQNISVSYQWPIRKINTNLKLYVSAENVFTITNYSGFDPDVTSTTENDDFGIDQNSYPMPRNYTLGIELTF